MVTPLYDLWLSPLSILRMGDSWGWYSFKDEGLVTPEGWEGEKGKKVC